MSLAPVPAAPTGSVAVAGRSRPPWWAWSFAALALVAGTVWNLSVEAPAASVAVLLATAAAIVLARGLALLALGCLVLSAVLQLVLGVEVNPVQALAGGALYLVGRRGTIRAHWLAGGTVAVLGILQISVIAAQGSSVVLDLPVITDLRPGLGVTAVLVVGILLLAGPLVAGVVEQAHADAREDDAARRRAEDALVSMSRVAQADAERARLARDVHDTVGHALTVVITQSRVLGAVVDRDPALAAQAASTVERVATAALDEVRRVLAGTVTLADVTLEDLIGLAESADQVRFAVRGEVPPLPGELGEAVYRAMQELITNALRHGSQKEPVDVRIGAAGDLVVEVVNSLGRASGSGAERAAPRGTGSGLVGIRERLDAVGGRLDAQAVDDRWVARLTVELVVPR